jgi:hypothetical protein
MALRNLRFHVAVDRGRGIVRLANDDGSAIEDSFDVGVLSGARLAGVLSGIESGRCRPDDLRDVGTHLWDALFHGAVEQAFERERADAERSGTHLAIRLSLPADLETFPWEALYDERRRSFVAIEPGYSLLRDGVDVRPPALADREARPLSVLAVIPEGSGLHIDHEWNNLRLAVGQLGDGIRLERLDGRITSARLLEKLRSRSWDVLHYVGHGEVGAEGTVRIRLNAESGSDADYWIGAEPFSTLFSEHPPRLVVLNCCLGAMPDPRRSLGGVGPLMMRRGVPAIISMRYEIQDDVAIKFADAFYRELLVGDDPGRVDLALRHARHAIYLSQTESSARGFVTPILHLAPGCEALFDLPGRAPAVIATPSLVSDTPSRVPAELEQAIRQRECVLVLGTLGGTAVRSAADGTVPAPGPRELALQLAMDSQYPAMTDFDLALDSESWLIGSVLPAVCQHYQHRRRRLGLIQAIQQIYQKATPRAPQLAVAEWDAPGIIYTHFDGMMEEAFKAARRTVRLMPSLDHQIDGSDAEGLLVHLRGTVKDERSLVLTEEDHDTLWQLLSSLPSRIVELTRGKAGRSVLFMGVSPRDPLVRRLSLQLLETGKNRLQGPTYFVCADHTAVDDAYWEKYDVNWIPMGCEELVASIAQSLQVRA